MLRSALLLLVLVLGCSADTPPRSARTIVDPSDAILTLTVSSTRAYFMGGDSAWISAAVEGIERSRLTCEWSASCGRICGQGSQVLYIAPDSVATVDICVTATDKNSRRYEGRFRAPIHRQFVIIKADDFVYSPYEVSGIAPGWGAFLTYIQERNLKACVGIIGGRIRLGHDDYFATLRDLQVRGIVEYFNHGWDHLLDFEGEDGKLCSEFRNTSYERQTTHLQATQRLVWEKMNIVLRGFGAPGNAFDATTRRVINEAEDIEYWFFGDRESDKIVLQRYAEIEDPVGIPNYEKFRATYTTQREYLVYQIHPWFWTEDKLAEFSRCIDDLVSAQVTFILASEYCELYRPRVTCSR